MSPPDFTAKAEQAISSAELLLSAGDVDGACNRAYYAMFDVARAMLMAAASHTNAARIRTHAGLIGEFGRDLVKTGQVPAELGRSLNRAHEIRTPADFGVDTVDLSRTAELVEAARNFVEALRDLRKSIEPR